MEFIKRLKTKYNDFVLDHPVLKSVLGYTFSILATIVAAFCLAYNYRAFIFPTANVVTSYDPVTGEAIVSEYNLIAGGASGLGQVISLTLQKIGIDLPITEEMLQSILYIVINTPLILLAFFGIGKRFATLSLINIVLTSILISVIPENWTTIFSIQNDLFARAIFAGVLNGLGISIAVELNHSTGGTDIVSMYFALKKGKSIGKYVLVINGTIVLIYTLLSSIGTDSSPSTQGAATMALYTLVLFFTSTVVIDLLSTRNKKVQLQIVTSEPRLAKVLIQHFPHGCTILDAKGAFYNTDKKVILTVLSSFELKRAHELIYKIDPKAFVTVTNANKVFGKFFIRPMK